MNAEIISIGTELLLGEINDTNATYIAQQLKNIGLNLYYRSTVGDNEERITNVIKLAMSRADIIITTGGLGPTVDDMTRLGVANAVNQPLERREELVADLREKFKRFNAQMSDSNLAQATMPRDAIAVDNPVGTAPAFIVETEQGAIISLPGVPREMKYLMEHAVLPYLQKRVGTGIIKLRVLRTAGAGESWLGEQINDLMRMTNPTVGTAAHSGYCDVRITSKAPTEIEADLMISGMELEIRKRIGEFIFGVDKDPLEGALISALNEAGGQVAISETGTNGMLRQRLFNAPSGEAVIHHAAEFDMLNDLRKKLELTTDADHQKLAEAAVATLLKSGAKIAIGIVSDSTGTVISVSNGTTTRNRSYAYGGVDQGGPEWATGWGMSMAWLLLGQEHAEKSR
jgi:nicotinamide-nucleotide amidase